MRNYLAAGPLRVRISSHGLARWGYERIGVAGFSFLSRDSGGDLMLAAYHPRRSLTWHWSVSLRKRQAATSRWVNRAPSEFRSGQWHDYYRLPFGWEVVIAMQNFHQGRVRQG